MVINLDSVLDWDSLWKRTTRVVPGILKVKNKKDFKNMMIKNFFKGRSTRGIRNLSEELFDKNMEELEIINLVEKKKVNIKVEARRMFRKKKKAWKSTYKIKETTWRKRPAVFIRNKKGRFVSWYLK